MTTAAGLAALFLDQRPKLLRLLTARLASAAEAEDALQELWLRIDGLASKPIADPAAYLFRMANNLATDRRVATVRRERLETAWVETRPDAAEHPDAERQMLARDRLNQAQAVLAAMPERMRQAYMLARIDGLAQRDIATHMDISLSAVEKLLARGYTRFHRLEGATDADD